MNPGSTLPDVCLNSFSLCVAVDRSSAASFLQIFISPQTGRCTPPTETRLSGTPSAAASGCLQPLWGHRTANQTEGQSHKRTPAMLVIGRAVRRNVQRSRVTL